MIRSPLFNIFLTLFTLPMNNYAKTTSSTTTLEPTPIIFLDDYHSEESWTPKYKPSVIVETDDCYIISVRIEYCDLDGANGEYVTIGTGQTDETLTFTYKISNRPSYLFRSRRLYVDFVGKNVTNFNALFTRINRETSTSTTEAPTTQDWPTAPTDNSEYLTVFIAGKSAEEYRNVETNELFKRKVSQMAKDYCENENIALTQEITMQNVYYSKILPCPPTWPEQETCAQVTFAVPVFLNESSDSRWKGYQMSSSHLRIMWDRLSEKYFNDDLTNYVEPHFHSMLMSLIIVISAVTVGFTVFLLAFRFFVQKLFDRRRKDYSDQSPIIIDGNNNDNIFYPHDFQETPAIFENIYSNFNPEQGFENVSTMSADQIRKLSEVSQSSVDNGVSTA